MEDLQETLRSMGVGKTYFPSIEPETGTILLKTRKPAVIVDGFLSGSECSIYDQATFLLWTHKKQKARRLAKTHALKVLLLDNEAELFVQAHLADAILPSFGVKTKRQLSPEAINKLRARLSTIRPNKNSVTKLQ